MIIKKYFGWYHIIEMPSLQKKSITFAHNTIQRCLVMISMKQTVGRLQVYEDLDLG